MAIFESKKSSNDIINNGTMSDDEVVVSDVPPRYLFPSLLTFLIITPYLHIYIRHALQFEVGSRGEYGVDGL